MAGNCWGWVGGESLRGGSVQVEIGIKNGGKLEAANTFSRAVE
jgi:hypothetical protein